MIVAMAMIMMTVIMRHIFFAFASSGKGIKDEVVKITDLEKID